MKKIVKISVIIPTIGRKKLLFYCLHSLFHQSILPKEIIIVDNSFSRQAQKIINHIYNQSNVNIKYIHEPKKGPAFARNAGIKKAKYDLIAFIDDDCVADKNWIKSIFYYHQLSPYLILQGKSLNGLPNNIFACLEHFTTESFILSGIFKERNNKHYLSYSKYIDTKNVAFSKLLFNRFHYFDTKYQHILEDIDFSVRINHKGYQIRYNHKMLIKHLGRTNLFSHLKREFYKGRDFYRFQKKWSSQAGLPEELGKEIEKFQEEKKKNIEQKLKKEILNGKSPFFSLFFYLILYIDKLTIKSGYLHEKIKSQLLIL